jgi:hypothetical protein
MGGEKISGAGDRRENLLSLGRSVFRSEGHEFITAISGKRCILSSFPLQTR